MVNFHEHVSKEFQRIHLDQYFAMGGELDELEAVEAHGVVARRGG